MYDHVATVSLEETYEIKRVDSDYVNEAYKPFQIPRSLRSCCFLLGRNPTSFADLTSSPSPLSSLCPQLECRASVLVARLLLLWWAWRQACCGAKMVSHTTNPNGKYLYHYYSCHKRRELRQRGPCRQRSLRASEVEPVVWDFVSGLLKAPERIRAGMNALIDQERAASSRSPGEEATVWAKKIEQCDRLRSAYQDQQAGGLMTLEELGSKLKGLEETRKLAQAELAALETREKRVRELEKDRDALLESWASAVPKALDGLTGQERNQVYRMLRLEVTPTTEGFRVTGALGGFLHSGTAGFREATVKKLKGARLRIPSRLIVEVQAIGRGTTEPISSL